MWGRRLFHQFIKWGRQNKMILCSFGNLALKIVGCQLNRGWMSGVVTKLIFSTDYNSRNFDLLSFGQLGIKHFLCVFVYMMFLELPSIVHIIAKKSFLFYFALTNSF